MSRHRPRGLASRFFLAQTIVVIASILAAVLAAGLGVLSASGHCMVAAWYPEPAPISSTLQRRVTSSAWVISPTTEGWLMVWPQAMGSGVSS